MTSSSKEWPCGDAINENDAVTEEIDWSNLPDRDETDPPP
jgi:hypothetical protein